MMKKIKLPSHSVSPNFLTWSVANLNVPASGKQFKDCQNYQLIFSPLSLFFFEEIRGHTNF